MLEHNVRLDDMMPLFRERLEQGQKVQFSPRGTSMLPLLRQGRDTVILSPLPQRRLKKYELPLYQRQNGQYVIHRIVKTGEQYTCIGDNQFQLEPGVEHEQMIALVTGVIRDGREHSVDALGYRLYCRFWHHSRKLRYILWNIKALMRRVLK